VDRRLFPVLIPLLLICVEEETAWVHFLHLSVP
jgi:hypothetical protein